MPDEEPGAAMLGACEVDIPVLAETVDAAGFGDALELVVFPDGAATGFWVTPTEPIIAAAGRAADEPTMPEDEP